MAAVLISPTTKKKQSDYKGASSTFRRNIGNYLQVDTAGHPITVQHHQHR
jgi:hypothetical protein